MSPVLVPIAEGDGEVEAAPVLLRRLLGERHGHWDWKVVPSKNAHGRGNLTKPGGLEKFIKLAWREPNCAAVLVLADADDAGDCPATQAASFSTRIRALGVLRPTAVVFARREYETWFLASLETIAEPFFAVGHGAHAKLPPPADVEAIRDAKGWLARHYPQDRSYKETQDQAPMSALLDISLAWERSRSFRRLCHAVEELMQAVEADTVIVTPSK